MVVENAKYIKGEFESEVSRISCIRDVVSGSVGIDPNDSTYNEIMRLVDAGELTIEPADE